MQIRFLKSKSLYILQWGSIKVRLRQLNEEISQKVAPDSDKIAEPNVASKQVKKEDKVVRQTQEEEEGEEENY